ncbi:hypothetical protein IDH44_25560 [Paenibacillus sp. IB182496]|uniref:Uncharacterized protein n=1 Tax=Paenibacillus sabuli TaxID=2772509 RepID=A0A927BZQ9_9BACL|nr:hypothetical protein [Paenibacillus sabuli]MBD2848560.1 hypothetical protein [Paenibacillus sabuli]
MEQQKDVKWRVSLEADVQKASGHAGEIGKTRAGNSEKARLAARWEYGRGYVVLLPKLGRMQYI